MNASPRCLQLPEAYQRLDVTYLPRGERRAEAVRAACWRGRIPNPTAHDGPSIAEHAAPDRNWDVEKGGDQ
ncbi:hypothetical protein ACWFR5_26065 [Streptomyces sp. NPDC055092]|uniref:hypothetical protein n=1 Tax=Streptomyces sp. NPDC127172 TaxID=3345382 RepID=UPI003628F34E